MFLLNDRRIWILEAQKHIDPTDPDPEHWFLNWIHKLFICRPTWTSPPKRTESSCMQRDMRREVEVGLVAGSANVISATSSLASNR
jgi:hypothetical protein